MAGLWPRTLIQPSVLTSEANRRWAVKIDDLRALASTNSVFVTVEPKGEARSRRSMPISALRRPTIRDGASAHRQVAHRQERGNRSRPQDRFSIVERGRGVEPHSLLIGQPPLVTQYGPSIRGAIPPGPAATPLRSNRFSLCQGGEKPSTTFYDAVGHDARLHSRKPSPASSWHCY